MYGTRRPAGSGTDACHVRQGPKTCTARHGTVRQCVPREAKELVLPPGDRAVIGMRGHKEQACSLGYGWDWGGKQLAIRGLASSGWARKCGPGTSTDVCPDDPGAAGPIQLNAVVIKRQRTQWQGLSYTHHGRRSTRGVGTAATRMVRRWEMVGGHHPEPF